MPKAVLDSTVLVSAFLSKTGISRELLRKAKTGGFTICLSEEILAETERVLLEYTRIRKRYPYADEAAAKYIQLLRIVCQVITELPKIKAVARDPNDDMIIACGIKAKARYIVTRDKDMLELKEYERISIVSPEVFIVVVRY